MKPEEIWFVSIMITIIGLTLFSATRWLYLKYHRHYRLMSAKNYTVCSINGNDGNDDFSLSPLATIREAIERGRLSSVDAINICLLPGHIEQIDDEPLTIDKDNVRIVGSSNSMPKILFCSIESMLEIKGSNTFLADIAFVGTPGIINRGIVVDTGDQNVTFVGCIFQQVGCLYHAW